MGAFFHLIPFYVIYLVFIGYYGLAQKINKGLSENGQAGSANEGLALASCIMVLSGVPLGTIIGLISICNIAFSARKLAEARAGEDAYTF